MKYLSAKEAANRWKISANRVMELARNGRIPGSQIVGNSWIIPANAIKPADARTKQVNNKTEYRFPLYIFGNYNVDDIQEFSDDEKELYNAQRLYCECEIEKARHQLERILNSTQNIYVEIGTLYFLCFTYLHTREFAKLNNSLFRIRLIYEKNFAYKEELWFILDDLYLVFRKSFEKSTPSKIDLNYEYSESAHVYISVVETCRYLTQSIFRQEIRDITIFELICKRFESKQFNVAALYMHQYIATMYQLNENIDVARKHIEKAVMLSELTNCPAPLLGLSFANFELYKSTLEQREGEVSKKIERYHQTFVDDYSLFLEYSGITSFYKNLSMEDFKYINYIIIGFPNKRIAHTENLSESTVNKKLISIYEKLCVSGRKELYNLVYSSIMNCSDSKKEKA